MGNVLNDLFMKCQGRSILRICILFVVMFRLLQGRIRFFVVFLRLFCVLLIQVLYFEWVFFAIQNIYRFGNFIKIS